MSEEYDEDKVVGKCDCIKNIIKNVDVAKRFRTFGMVLRILLAE
jgi:hypothetical protein